MRRNLCLLIILQALMVNAYADEDPQEIQQGAQQYNWQNCINEKTQDCINDCQTSADIACSDSCDELASDKCQAQGLSPTS